MNIINLSPLPTSPHFEGKKYRSSNLELYRILCMLMIVAHHYVVNSGLFALDGPIIANPNSLKSLYLVVLGAWGKIGINCFLMITGYFMCTSQITFRKFLKLILQIYFYKLLLFPILLISGYETVSLSRLVKLIMPIWGFGTDKFVSCFIAFWLTIPFLNILIRNLNERQHVILILLSLCFFSLLGSLPRFEVPLNYITWFGVIYFIASYFRLYSQPLFERTTIWGVMTILIALLSIASIIGVQSFYGLKGIDYSYFFVRDSNKLLAVAFAICSFLWFKNINIKYNKTINAFGAATFGVLLIHANSNAMRKLLWIDTVDCVGHYSLSLGNLIFYSVGVIIVVFVVCNLIDQLRIAYIEKCFFNWYDNKLGAKADAFINKLIFGEIK